MSTTLFHALCTWKIRCVSLRGNLNFLKSVSFAQAFCYDTARPDDMGIILIFVRGLRGLYFNGDLALFVEIIFYSHVRLFHEIDRRVQL